LVIDPVLKDSGRCFACGKDNPHGLKLPVAKTAEGVELRYAIPEGFAGWQGIVHGGIVATILDELLAWAANQADRNTVTAEMSVRYRKPVRTGQPIRGIGRITEDKGRLLLAEARLLDDSGNLLAEATGKMMRITDASSQ
jgi:uncharacterized protein (TIGR00369 family)